MKLSRSVREAVISAATLSAGTTSTTCRSRSSLQPSVHNMSGLYPGRGTALPYRPLTKLEHLMTKVHSVRGPRPRHAAAAAACSEFINNVKALTPAHTFAPPL